MNRQIIIFTVVEFVALVAWLALTGINAVAAIIVLFGGLILEHVLSFRLQNPTLSIPIGRVALIGVVETITWVAWLALTNVNAVLAAGVLFVGLLVGHVIFELNTTHQMPIFAQFGRRARQALDITTIEVVASVIWLGLAVTNPIMAAIVLFVGLLIEHQISVRKKVD